MGNVTNIMHSLMGNIKTFNYITMFIDSQFNGDSSWDVSSVTNMIYVRDQSQFNGDIFMGCFVTIWVYVNSQFNGDISSWDVSKVLLIMAFMFVLNSIF